MRRRILVEVGGVFNLERLTVKEWQRERGTTKKRRRRSWRSGTGKNHPRKYLGEERLRGAWFLCGLVLWTIGCFPCRALYPYFIRKDGGIAEQKPLAKTPTNPRHREADPA